MKLNLKPIQRQTMVITGATSGIGLATARMAARYGARVVVAARNEEPLRELERELSSIGAPAVHVVADVSREEDVQRIADEAVRRFGGFDTWVNNAGTSIYGRIMEVPVEDERKLFEVNYWSVVYGTRIAVEHLRERGGAIINLGSVASDRAIPLQAAYCATKHAIKAYTDTLRMELENQQIPVSVTLIKPTGIDTPFFEHAKNYMSAPPTEPSPMYSPELVAEAILYAAERPARDLLVGDMAPVQSALGRFVPRLGDHVMRAIMFKGQKSKRPAKAGDNRALEAPSGTLQERGTRTDAMVFETSPYTKASMHPMLTGTIVAGAGLVLAALLFNSRSREVTDRPR